MKWPTLTAGGKRPWHRTPRTLPALRLLHMQVIAVLSAVIFAVNFCLEILVLFSGSREHQILMLLMQLCLATWAIAELFILSRRQPPEPMIWLGTLLVIQILLEAARLSLAIWGTPFGVQRGFGIFIVNAGLLSVLLPLYLFVFFGIIKSLMVIHRQELEDAWEHLTKSAIAESKQQEREQLLRDMHDGFGSQIATMRIMAEQGRLDPHLIPDYLKEISADLHLIVDTFRQAADVTLSSALADLRYRMRQRFGDSATRLHWKIDLHPDPDLDHRAILNVLRIIQEALNNALRHATPENIWIEARTGSSTKSLRVSVRNDGLSLPDTIQKRRGLSNMETRARELGGRIQWVRHDPGSEVVVTIDAVSGNADGRSVTVGGVSVS